MKTPAFLFATVCLVAFASADNQFRDAQAELKNQGFYYGEVDGKESAEASAAIRRYQIRNGLTVTGKLNDETLKALGIGASPESATPAQPHVAKPVKPPTQLNPPAANERNPSPNETDPIAKRGKDLLRAPDADEDAPPMRRPLEDPSVVAPPTPVPSPTYDDYSTFYHGTPYANAPRVIQTDILRKAQTQLARRRLYNAAADGLPGTATSDALFLYQEQRQLNRTGRLDLQTLADLNLLPGRPDAPPLRPFRDPNRGRDRTVDYRGLYR